MADLVETFNGNRIHASLHAASMKAESIRASVDEADPNAVEHADAIIEAVRQITLRVHAVDPVLANLPLIDNVAQGVDGIVDNLSAYEQDPAVGLGNTHGQVLEALRRAAAVPAKEPHSQVASDIADQAATLVEQDTAKAMADIKRLKESVSSSVAQSQVLIDQITEQLVAQQATVQSARQDLEQESVAFAAMVTRSEAAIEAVTDEIREIRALQEQQLEATVSEYKTWETTARARVDTLNRLIDKLAARADEMLLNAGGAALGTSWKTQAKAHRIERWSWTGGIIVLLGGSVALAFLTLDDLTAPAGSSFVDGLVFYIPRIPFAIITITILGFAIQQAARRAQFEARDARVGNELSALPEFLSRVPDGARDELSKQVAANYFPGTKLEHDVP